MKIRQSNYELMRIISMFLIVLYHALTHGGVLNNTVGVVHLIFTFIICFTVVHVNSFILLMGYFNYNKEFSLKRFFKTFNMAWFYEVIIVIIVCLLGIDTFTGKYQIVNAISPLNDSYWFVVCYLVVYVLSPYLNKLIAILSQADYRKLLIILFLLFSVIPFVTKGILISNNGYTIIHFIFLYLIGAYLRKYPLKENFHFKNYSHNKLKTIFFSFSVGCCLFHFSFYLLSGVLINYENSFLIDLANSFKGNLLCYSAPLVLIQSIFYFVWFGEIKLQNKFINYIGGLTLGVYLIHDNRCIRSFIYKWLGLDNGKIIYGSSILLKVFIVVVLIFIVCLLIELVRKQLFKFINNRNVVKKVKTSFYNYVANF